MNSIVSKSKEMVDLTMALFAKFWINETRMNFYHSLLETLPIRAWRLTLPRPKSFRKTLTPIGNPFPVHAT